MNEKKLGAIIVLLIACVAPAMILGGYVANALDSPQHHGHPPGLAISDRYLTKNTANLNFSCTISNQAKDATPINQLKMVMDNKEFTSLTVYVNGSLIDCASKPLFSIQSGDNACVSALVPYVSNPYALSALQNNGNMSAFYVITLQAMYYSECSLSGS